MPVYREEMMLVAACRAPEVSRATQVSGSDVYAFRANCSYADIWRAGFMPTERRPGAFMRWSPITACWPASLRARASR
jgi:hypothetical protein